MLEVEVNHQIILLHYREGLSLRQIAKKLKIHRKTVKARIVEYEHFKAGPADDEGNSSVILNQYLQTGTVYDGSTRSRRKLTDEIIQLIDACLLENEIKRLDGRVKQRLKKIDIHEKLLAAGYSVSYSLVCQYIVVKLASSREAFIKQDYIAGACCEFDWAEVKLNLDGAYRRYYLAVFASSFSNYRYALLFERQDTLAFKEAHINFFEHIGGVYQQVVYDNMRVAIARFVGRTEKVPTEGLLQLSRWYQYQWRFCNAARGNEKGHVERSVEYVRRKVFGFKEDFDSFSQAQDYLLQRVAELNTRPSSRGRESSKIQLEIERKGLYSYPGLMECFSAENLRVDKYATITFGNNKYSVPDRLVGIMVFVKIYSEWLKVFDGDGVVCEHKRLYGRYGWQIELNHYLCTLQRKPGAMAGSVALKQASQWMQDIYKEHFIHDTRSFIELLQYCHLNMISDDKLKVSVDRIILQSPAHVMATHVMALLGNQQQEVPLVSDLPDPIAVQSLENLIQLAAMMNYN